MGQWIRRSVYVWMAIIGCLSMSASQTRGSGTKSNTLPRAPFLLQAKSYEESPFVTRVDFKNGMTVLVQEVRSLPVLAIQAYVYTGGDKKSNQDAKLAEILASAVGRGGRTTSTGTYRQRMHLLGGFLKHSIDIQNTMFEMTLPSAQWKQALALMEEILLHPSIDVSAMQMEHRLAEEASLARIDDPIVFSRKALIELGFHETQTTQAKLPDNELLSKYDPEKLIALHRSLYVPSGITLIVSGNVRSSDILNEVCRLFDQGVSPRTKLNLKQKIYQQKEFQYHSLHGNITAPRILFGYHAPTETDEDFRAIEILNAILGIGEGAVLPFRLRDEKKLVYSANAVLDRYSDYGFLSIEMTTDPQNIDKSEIAALTEIELLKKNGPNPSEMERAVAMLEHAYWKNTETVSGKASWLAHFEFLGDWKRKDRYIAELRNVKANDVKKVANRYLQLKNCSLLEYLPKTMEARNLASENVFRTLDGLLEPSANQEQESRSKKVAYSADIPREQRPFQYSEIQYPFKKASILRGPDMYIREDHTSPLIDLGIFFPGGKQFEDRLNTGITELMTHLMLQGDEEYEGTEFLYQMEVFGGTIQPIIKDDYFGFYFSIPAVNFAPAFKLLQEAIRNPTFSKQAFERQKELQLNRIFQRNASRQYLRKLVDQMLFKDFPYALDATGTEESLAAITQESLQNWHVKTVHNKKPIILVVGDVNGTSLAAYFVGDFSGSRMQNAETLKDFVKPLDKEYLAEKQGYGSESMIFVGFQAPPTEDEDWQIANVLECYLGGQGKLLQEIRDREGISRKVSLIYKPRLRGGSIIASATMNLGNESKVLKLLKDEIQRIRSAPIEVHDFSAAINSAIGSHEIRNQVRANQISDLIENLLAGRDINEYQDYTTDIQNITPDDLKAVAKKIFDMDKSVILRVHANSQ